MGSIEWLDGSKIFLQSSMTGFTLHLRCRWIYLLTFKPETSLIFCFTVKIYFKHLSMGPFLILQELGFMLAFDLYNDTDIHN